MSYKTSLNNINPENSAFLIGNGINYYAGTNEDCSKCINRNICEDKPTTEFKCGWDSLLQELCDIYEIPITTRKLRDISFPELASLAEIKISSDTNGTALKSIAQFKGNLIELITKYQIEQDQHPVYKRLLHYAKEYNMPIITTNFDMLLSQGFNEHRLSFKDDTFFSSNDSYIWNYCYSDIQDHPDTDNFRDFINGFSVWHIHGNIKHPRSIKIGLDDYVNNCAKVKSMMSRKSKNDTLTTLFDLQPDKWIGRNTLLDIIFHKNLIIVGLSLESQEVFLRWLLIQRKKYLNAMLNKYHAFRPKAWFVSKGDLCETSPQSLFFRTCGVEPISVEKYCDIYMSFKV